MASLLPLEYGRMLHFWEEGVLELNVQFSGVSFSWAIKKVKSCTSIPLLSLSLKKESSWFQKVGK